MDFELYSSVEPVVGTLARAEGVSKCGQVFAFRGEDIAFSEHVIVECTHPLTGRYFYVTERSTGLVPYAGPVLYGRRECSGCMHV